MTRPLIFAALTATAAFALCACRSDETIPASGPRPAKWAAPVSVDSPGNCYRVSDELYRAEQPEPKQLDDLKKLGVRTLLSLREYHADDAAFGRAGLTLARHPMAAGSVAPADLVIALRHIRNSPKPVLVHCWHGSDRTGFVVAGYRMAEQGWSAEEAIAELRDGGFGHHEVCYPNITRALRELDVAAIRAELKK